MATRWCERRPALKRLRLTTWSRRRLASRSGLRISASSSSIGRFMNASFVGANTVHGPAEGINNVRPSVNPLISSTT